MEKDIKTCIECYEGPESGAPAGNKKGLNIINDINDMYNEQLKKLQDDSESEGALKLQLNTLQDWVCDLMEQNKILVKTIEELEAEALKRHQNTYPVAAPVAAPVGLEEVQQVGSSGLPVRMKEEGRNDDLSETNHSLVREQKELTRNLVEAEDTIDCFRNDLLNLLELLRRLRLQGVWNLEGLRFNKVSYEDIFGQPPPPGCSCQLPNYTFPDYMSNSGSWRLNFSITPALTSETSMEHFCCPCTCSCGVRK